jgi:hypothetical protein
MKKLPECYLVKSEINASNFKFMRLLIMFKCDWTVAIAIKNICEKIKICK